MPECGGDSMEEDAHDDEMLVGDTEREQAETLLRDACVDGRLTLAEFSDRMDTLLAARTRGQLRTVSRNLAPVAVARPGSLATTQITAILSENKRSGRWRAVGRVSVVAIMGNCKVDLRQAEIVGGELVLDVRSVMADVKIYVPKGVSVVMADAAILSSSNDMRGGDAPLPQSPVIRVRGFGLMSSVEVMDDDDPKDKLRALMHDAVLSDVIRRIEKP
jgi:hypothetical protein